MNLFQKIEDVGKDFCTFPMSFEKYGWYKPILVGALAAVLYFVFSMLLGFIVSILFPQALASLYMPGSNSSPGLETLGGLYTSIDIALIFPSFFIAFKIVRDSPFSSYLSSRGGWNWKIFAKSFLIILVVYGIISLVEILIFGAKIDIKFTAVTFLAMIVVTLLQCFAEELMCRGFLMQTFGSWFRIPVVAIILQAVIFTAIHSYNMTGLVSVLFSGLCYGLLAWYCDGLEVSSALHCVNNITVFFIAGITTTQISNNVGFEGALEGIIMTVVAIAAIFLIEKKFNWIGLKAESSPE